MLYNLARSLLSEFAIVGFYIGVVGFLFAIVSVFVGKKNSRDVQINKFSYLLGLFLPLIVLLKSLDLISSIDLHRVVLTLVYFLAAFLIFLDFRFNESHIYTLSPILILIAFNIFHRPTIAFFVSSLILAYLVLISSLFAQSEVIRGLNHGVLCIILCSVVRLFLDYSASFQYGIGNSFFVFTGLEGRFQGVLSQPNGFAILCCLKVLLSTRLGIGMAIPLVILELMTGSKTSIIAFLCIFAVKIFRINIKKDFLLLIGFFVIAIPIFSILYPNSWNSFGGRSRIWDFAFNSLHRSPIVGFGGEYWTNAIETGLLPSYAGQGHSQLIETLVQSGAIGFVITFLLLVKFYRNNVGSEVLPNSLLGKSRYPRTLGSLDLCWDAKAGSNSKIS